MRNLKIVVCTCLCLVYFNAAQSQSLLKKIKQKAETVADRVIEKKTDDGSGNQTASNENSYGSNTGNTGNSSGSSNPSNKGGQGLVTTPPDVKEHLTTAETAFKSNNFNEARYAVQQAMLGVEMEIGQGILKSLPETVANLKKDMASDQVTSTGWGWAGLTIHREYEEGQKQFQVTVSNNAAWMQAINLYFNNAAYAQSTGGEQKWKQTKVKGNRAIIEYDKNSGYKLSVPIGQTSLLMFQGINFATEQDMMNAVNQIDIDGIKTRLGEK